MADSFYSDFGFEPFYSPEELRPSIKDWLRHGFLFLLTFFSATVAGLVFPFGEINVLERIPVPTNYFDCIFFAPYFFSQGFAIVFHEIALNPAIIINGLLFSICLLAILTAHEFGHYIACRIYGVKSTLPYFLPLPFLSPAGTLGAVIKIQSPMPTQRAIFDIGVAGPLAGFAVLVPVAIMGLATMQIAPPVAATEGSIIFTDPLLTRFLGALMGVDPTQGVINPFYAAAWIGLLVTALNLLPAGQLDGGHAVFSVFGERVHFGVGRVAFVGMLILTVLGWQLYGSPGTLIFTILLGILLRFPHPPPIFDHPLDRKRKAIAFLTLIVFILSFMPFPVQIH
jgi:membrane-associated protease RseP (regulator of RpoE activity)